MKKATYNLIATMTGAIEAAAIGVITYLAATGVMKSATMVAAITGSISIIGSAIIGVCAKFVTDDTTAA
jgi:hypothetical protein